MSSQLRFFVDQLSWSYACVRNHVQYLLGDVHGLPTNDKDAIRQMLDRLSEVVDGGRGTGNDFSGGSILFQNMLHHTSSQTLMKN